jgi:CBS-domain-containing membrane protein
VGENFLKDFGGTRALLVGVAIAAMKMTGTVHPPVGAYAVLMADVPAIKVFEHTHTHTHTHTTQPHTKLHPRCQHG